MAGRLARQRQQRSMLRTAAIPADDAIETLMPATVGSELSILRAEVATSGQTISALKAQAQARP